MAATGGRTPFDQNQALTGPARVVYGSDVTVVGSDLWSIVAAKNTAGEYPLAVGWKDLGLAADAPSYTHSKETTGIEYQQPTSALFEQISNITRTFTAQVAEISPENVVIIENTQAPVETIVAAANKSAQKKVSFGLYDEFITRPIALISFRPGAASVIEPDGKRRPPAVALVLPVCRLSAEDSELSFERGTPVNAAVTFTVFRDPTQPAGEEHGYWIFEQPGTILAV